MSQTALFLHAVTLHRWAVHKALPFWAFRGQDKNGGFYEDLFPDRRANTEAIRRFRVQARQLYVYSFAHIKGWHDSAKLIPKSFDFMLEKGLSRDNNPGFVHLIGPKYEIVDAKRDFYDHAFYLLACAWVYQATHNPKAKEVGDEICRFITEDLKAENGGWLESLPETLPRRQNPHMHFLEACLTWMEISDDPKWRALADQIIHLFHARFFDPEHHIVREFFDADWSVADGELGETAEPGHAAEWIWLLGWYERLTGISQAEYANALYDRLLASPGDFLNDEEDIYGNVRRETRRLWCQTELIKAHLAQAERGIPEASEMASAAIEGFIKHYLNDDGTWRDQIGACDQNIAAMIPASTFYHIICMIGELVRIAES